MKRCKILMLCLLCGICVIGICVKQSLRKKFYDYNVIAHAGGGIDGHIYTDSLEAINNSYDNGARLFDIDLRFTSDIEIVLRHDWTGIDLEQPEFEYLYHVEQWASEYCQEQNKFQENICRQWSNLRMLKSFHRILHYHFMILWSGCKFIRMHIWF